MNSYLDYFFERTDQILVLFCICVVWFGFRCIGAAIGGRTRLAEADHLVGWAVVSVIFTLGGVFLTLPFIHLAVVSAVCALGAVFWVVRRDGITPSPAWGRTIVLFLPLIVLVSAMRGSQWDEFSTWLIIPQFLMEADHFPVADSNIPRQALVGYPYSWHYISYLIGRLSGRFFENAGALSNIVLLIGFAVLLMRLIRDGLGRETSDETPAGWVLCAIAGLAVTLANPTFAQKVVLTAYADVASAITTAVGAVLGWRLIEALRGERRHEARTHAFQMGMVFLVLVNLKQSTLVLFVLCVIAITMIAVRDHKVGLISYARCLPLMTVPPVLIYAAWRYYVQAELSEGELSVLAMDKWAIAQIPEILWAMAVVLAQKGFYLFLAVVMVGFGIHGFWRSETPFDRLAAMCAAVVLAYTAFLFFVYVAVFGADSGPRVYSYWRYNMHLGFLFVAFVAYGGACLWRRHGLDGRNLGPARWLPVVLILAAPLVFAEKLRFDKAPAITHYRLVAAGVAGQILPSDVIFVVDPGGSGESGVITGYEVGAKAAYTGYMSAFDVDKTKILGNVISNPKLTTLVLYSTIPEFSQILGLVLDPQLAYLVKREGETNWRIIRSWPRPKT